MKRLPLLIACLGALAVSGCAGSVHVTDVQPHEGVAPAGYEFAPLSPNGPDFEVKVRQLVASQLAARGFHSSAKPSYVIDVAMSQRPGRVGVYTPLASRDDAPVNHSSLWECDDHAFRVAVIVVDKRTGHILSGERGGQTSCSGEDPQILPRLVEAAVTAALR